MTSSNSNVNSKKVLTPDRKLKSKNNTEKSPDT